MNIESNIEDFIKSKNKKKNIIGLRGLVKISENEWSFRYTFQNGDFLSLSDLNKVFVNLYTGKVSWIRRKKINKISKKELVKA